MLALFCVGSLALLLLAVEPIPQDLAYHGFCDSRALLGVPNFLDVASNAPFVLVGAFGALAAVRVSPRATRPAWLTFCIGVAAVGLGSGYYHLDPTNPTLVWDRLPMTIAFMALSALLVGEYFGRHLVNWTLLPAVALGACSVLYWHLTDDLRFYAWVQFMPLGAIALLLVLFPDRLAKRRLLLIALGLYLLAKLFEHYDGAVFRLTMETVSGHTLKHLAAAAGSLVLLSLPGGPRANGERRGS